MKREPGPVVGAKSSGLAVLRRYWSRRIIAWRARQHFGSAGYGTEGYGAPGNKTAGSAPVVTSRVRIAAVSRLTTASSPVATTYLALWWLSEARGDHSSRRVRRGVFIVATVATRRLLIRAARIRSVLSLGGPLTGSALRDVLRTLTRDPGLEVYYRLRSCAEYVTSVGEPAPWRGGESPSPARQLIGAGTVDGQGFTALVDAATPADRTARTLRRAVLEAATPALENARLQATLRRQVLDLISSRSRTVRAFLAERRRLEGPTARRHAGLPVRGAVSGAPGALRASVTPPWPHLSTLPWRPLATRSPN